jgi:predicted permease
MGRSGGGSGRPFEFETSEEIRFHLDMRAEELRAEGLSPEEARRRAVEAFGDPDAVVRACAAQSGGGRDGALVGALRAFAADFRLAFRNLGKAPAFTAVTVLTLAVGIGANSSMFSVVNGVLLRPLPYDEPDRLVSIWSYFTAESGYEFPRYPVGSPEYFDFVAASRSFESLAAVSTEGVTLAGEGGAPEVLRAGWVSSSMFTVLRARPLLGRTLVQADDGATPAKVAVLSHRLWQRRFGGDSTVVGRTLDIGAEVSEEPLQVEVVGVMPEGFGYPDQGVDLWAPLPLDPARTWRQGHWFWMIGRLAPATTFEAATAETREIMERWRVTYPDHHVGHGFFLTPFLEEEVGDVRSMLWLLLGSVGFVLLVACANVANLLLTRAEARRRDVTVRCALGAGRGRILRQLFAENLVLATAGGALGLVLAWVGTDALLALEAGTIPRVAEVGLDVRVLAFTGAVVLLTTLVFGTVPALREASPDLSNAFRDLGRSATEGLRGRRFRKALVVAEIALSIVLVVGAGLMIRSFRVLLAEDAGFETEGLVFAQFSLPAADYTPDEAVVFFDRLLSEAASLPGVADASLISRPPLLYGDQNGRFHIRGRPVAAASPMCCIGDPVVVGAGLFELLGVPLLRGRVFDANDHRVDGGGVAVVDQALADRYFPGEDPLGQGLRIGSDESPYVTVVGVVGNVTFDAPGESFPHLYIPHNPTARGAHFLTRSTWLAARTTVGAAELVPRLRERVATLDPRLAIAQVTTMDELERSAVAVPRFVMTLLSVFGLIALLLGAIGVYGVIAQGVASRSAELGIRRALGAGGDAVVSLVVREGAVLAVLGIALGVPAALALSRLLGGLLHEVSPADPWTYAWVAVVVAVVASLATLLPALRANRIDPLEALRRG